MRTALQSVLLERVFMVLAVLALAVITAPLLSARTGHHGPMWLSLALFAAGLSGFGVLLAADYAPRFVTRLQPWRVVADLAQSSRELVVSRWGIYAAIVSLIANVNFAVAAFLLGRALGLAPTVWDMMAIMPAVTLTTTLPISFGGWGVREGMLVLLLGSLGVPRQMRCRCRCCVGSLPSCRACQV